MWFIFTAELSKEFGKKERKVETNLKVVSLKEDCDNDTVLIKVNPVGPVCHKGDDTCFKEINESTDFIEKLESVIEDRKINPSDSSYVSSLFKKGTNKIAQKVGEEAVELVIESKDNNDDLFLNESADLIFHYLILLQEKGFKMKDVVKVLKGRSL